MRVPIIAGNWKMHKDVQEAVSFIEKVKNQLPPADQLETAIAAPTLCLVPMVKAAEESPLKIMAENCYYKNEELILVKQVHMLYTKQESIM